MAAPNTGTLKTIDQTTLEVPETRMASAVDTQNFVRRLIDNDEKRSQKRARVNGLVDGNPPYKASKLKEANRADACNVNFGRARSYMESGSGSFYDLFSEAPGYVTVRTSHGTPEQQNTWSNIISGEVDRVLKDAKQWDYEMSLSLDNMVLHGTGPLMFEDSQRILPRAFLAGDLKVPEFTKSESAYWETCAVQGTYYPPELYEFIEDAESATAVGWDVEFVKKVIANAMDIRNQAGIQYEWEFYQSELKNNSLSYYNNTKICRIAHVYWREFPTEKGVPGRITHAIVERDTASGVEVKYLFISVGRYKDFDEAIHAMYFDHGNGGYHHSVTGLGVKMYSSMQYENRLLCSIMDKGFAPMTLVRPTSASASQKLQLSRVGNYQVLPPGTEFDQTPINGVAQLSIETYGVISNVNSQVLSSYKMPAVIPKTQGNPVTATEKRMEAAILSAISKTQFNRFYAQLDALYKEIYRRMTNLNSTDDRAKEFQARCLKLGVPKEALQRTEKIQATRVVGQGSAFMRKQAIDSIIPLAGALPEDGRDNLIQDKIAAEAGQSAVSRYYPRKPMVMADDQQAIAMLQVAAVKVGIPPVITSDQNPVEFANTFIQSAGKAIQSIQQGAQPVEVLKFLQTIGPAIAAHLKRFEANPMLQQVHEKMTQQFQMIGQAADKLKQALQKQAQQQSQQQQKQQKVMSDIELSNVKVHSDIALKNIKTKAQLQQSAEKHQQKMAIDDAEAAHDMALNRMRAFQE